MYEQLSLDEILEMAAVANHDTEGDDADAMVELNSSRDGLRGMETHAETHVCPSQQLDGYHLQPLKDSSHLESRHSAGHSCGAEEATLARGISAAAAAEGEDDGWDVGYLSDETEETEGVEGEMDHFTFSQLGSISETSSQQSSPQVRHLCGVCCNGVLQ